MRATILIIAIFLFLTSSYACDCPVKPSIDTAIKQSKNILVVKMLEFETVKIVYDENDWILNPDSLTYASAPMKSAIRRYKFSVESMYKGKRSKNNMVIYSFFTAGTCGYPFEIGGRYVIYVKEFNFRDSKGKKKNCVFYRYMYPH